MLALYAFFKPQLIRHIGGPGPEIPIPIHEFQPGEQVRLTVTVSTDGGQMSDSTVIVTVQGMQKKCQIYVSLMDYYFPEAALRCEENVATTLITLSCEGVPFPVESANCSINEEPPFPCMLHVIVDGQHLISMQ